MFALVQMKALERLGLSIRKAKLNPSGPSPVHTLLLTDSHTADKILKSARLEEIRFTILSNLLKYHPEAGKKMGGVWGERARKPLPRPPTERPLGARRMYGPGLLRGPVSFFSVIHASMLLVQHPATRHHPSSCKRHALTAAG